MSRRNAPENFFSAVRGCPPPCARTNPWFRGRIWGEKCAQEPTLGSAVKHCRFLDTGGGGTRLNVGLRCLFMPPSSDGWKLVARGCTRRWDGDRVLGRWKKKHSRNAKTH